MSSGFTRSGWMRAGLLSVGLLSAGALDVGGLGVRAALAQQAASASPFAPPPVASTSNISSGGARPASADTAMASSEPNAPKPDKPSRTKASSAPAGPLKRSYSSVSVGEKVVALTFDDGPNPATTPKLLDMLKARGVHATFFVLGTRAAENPALLRRMIAEGHEIGNHSWNHPQLPKISRAAADKQIADASAAIERATGKKPRYLRPPYGAMTPALRSHLEQKYGLTFVYWSVDPLDWKNRNAKTVRERILAKARPGSIILLHDIHATSVAAMPELLDTMLAKGYRFATVSELIAQDQPGRVHVASNAFEQSSGGKPRRSAAASTTHTGHHKPVAGGIGLY
ncbi:polysaccharide deacetylase family protein [Xanthobacter sp. TB0139]|uniref:polysaccharide deacetylase family protein n=1 Tax=Xanthobacter sp. TB0139 TaxID=3459178 RepID=UPI00403A387C